jgi:hypothetical protein
MSYPTVTTTSAPPTTSTNGFAIASFVTSLLGLSLLGVIFGHVSLRKIPVTGEGGKGLAVAGLVIGYLGLAVTLFLFILIPAISLSGS